MADSQLRARPGKARGKSPKPEIEVDDIPQKQHKVDILYSSYVGWFAF